MDAAFSLLDLNCDGIPESLQPLASGIPGIDPPVLVLSRSGTEVILTWPLRSDAEHFLAQSNDLALWRPWRGDISLCEGFCSVSFLVPSSRASFRLRGMR
ncbi:MAG: hypothetical protein KA004_07255 [Verrucomicrobiales bacterium]|nr:hypothetical protein [Verrucomicrobiales bacterium]